MKRLRGLRFYRSVKNESDDDDSSDSSSDSDSDSDSDSSSDSSDDSNETLGEYGFGCYTEKDEVDIDDEDDVEEISKKNLHDAIRPFYDGELFLIQNEADDRDVYFKHPNHPGTRAFVRASQKIVIRRGSEKTFDDRAFKRMRRLLYDSHFYVGKAPNCQKADDERRFRIFRARYEFDRQMMKRVEWENRESRPIPGTIWLQCSCCAHNNPEKKHWVTSLLGTSMGLPALVFLFFVSFGFLYFAMWFLFKTIITGIYVAIGVSISFLLGDDAPEEE